MVRMLRSAVVATILAVAVPTAAVAQTQLVDEFKFGVLAHDVGLFDSPVESGSDINFEMLFTPPEFFRVSGRRGPISAVRSVLRVRPTTAISASPGGSR